MPSQRRDEGNILKMSSNHYEAVDLGKYTLARFVTLTPSLLAQYRLRPSFRRADMR